MNSEQTSKPTALRLARVQVDLIVVIERCRFEHGDHFEQIEDMLDELPGVFFQGGGAQIMDRAEVVADSPVDEYLRAREADGA